ncbi:hypothetical protein PIB30_062537 [Stylosanthes scabra]|uniref:Uncharacterized protein n=1 Tax=Stylosanthes scabra TaxID=79078 RepID=A0ABU6SM11_9FABA|nr:hypothetical protein [Stylosanthes scabra]
MAVFRFLVSLPSGLLKRNKFSCRFILDGSDAEVGNFLDDLLDVKMKRTRLDDLMAKMVDPARMGPRPIVPTGGRSATATTVAAVAAVAASASGSSAGTSVAVAAGSPHVEPLSQVPSAPAASDARRRKSPSKRERSRVVDLEEEVKEDPAADLRSKRKRKTPEVDEAFEKALGDDSAWEHDVDPLKIAFPGDFDYRKALNAGLTSALVREALTKMPRSSFSGMLIICMPSRWLVFGYMGCSAVAFILLYILLYCSCSHFVLQPQVGVETALVAKIKAEKELSAALDQIEVLKGERDSALAFLPFQEKATTLEEHQSALDRIAQLEEDQRVLGAQFESSQLSLEAEWKRAVAAEGQVASLGAALKTCQANLSKATEASEYWRSEWHALGSESRWDPKGRRIFVPQETEEEVELPSAEGAVLEQGLAAAAQSSQPAAGKVVEVSGECPT